MAEIDKEGRLMHNTPEAKEKTRRLLDSMGVPDTKGNTKVYSRKHELNAAVMFKMGRDTRRGPKVIAAIRRGVAKAKAEKGEKAANAKAEEEEEIARAKAEEEEEIAKAKAERAEETRPYISSTLAR